MKKIIYLICAALMCMHNLSYAMDAEQFITAARMGNLDDVQRLIDTGIDIDVTNNTGETALLEAACMGHTELVNLLLESGANVNATNINYQTALWYAIRHGFSEIVDLLLQAGAGLNWRERNLITDNAASPNNHEIAMFVINHENMLRELGQYTDALIADARQQQLEHKVCASIDNSIILTLITHYKWYELNKFLRLQVIKDIDHKKLILDKALMHNDLAMIEALIASEYQIPKNILQKSMREDIRKFLERHLTIVETLYGLRQMQAESPQNTLGLMPLELMRYLVSGLAVKETPCIANKIHEVSGEESQKKFDIEETLYVLRTVPEAQNTLGLMPEELMRYLVSWLAVDERPASNA